MCCGSYLKGEGIAACVRNVGRYLFVHHQSLLEELPNSNPNSSVALQRGAESL